MIRLGTQISAINKRRRIVNELYAGDFLLTQDGSLVLTQQNRPIGISIADSAVFGLLTQDNRAIITQDGYFILPSTQSIYLLLTQSNDSIVTQDGLSITVEQDNLDG